MSFNRIIPAGEKLACRLCGEELVPPPYPELDDPQLKIAHYKHRETCNAETRPEDAIRVADEDYTAMELLMPGYERPADWKKTAMERLGPKG